MIAGRRKLESLPHIIKMVVAGHFAASLYVVVDNVTTFFMTTWLERVLIGS